MSLKRKQLKTEIKDLSVRIRDSKAKYKDAQRNAGPSWAISVDLGKAYWEFRHKHVAASLLRGTPMEKIEVRTKTNTPALNTDLVQQYVAEYGAKDEQAA
jgi:hypothetical protein